LIGWIEEVRLHWPLPAETKGMVEARNALAKLGSISLG